jgi:hypothetical protein
VNVVVRYDVPSGMFMFCIVCFSAKPVFSVYFSVFGVESNANGWKLFCSSSIVTNISPVFVSTLLAGICKDIIPICWFASSIHFAVRLFGFSVIIGVVSILPLQSYFLSYCIVSVSVACCAV